MSPANVVCAGCGTTQEQYSKRRGKAVTKINNKINKKIGLLLRPQADVQKQVDKLCADGFEVRLCDACNARNRREADKKAYNGKGGGLGRHPQRLTRACMQPEAVKPAWDPLSRPRPFNVAGCAQAPLMRLPIPRPQSQMPTS